ncbi:MAG: GntR family transcriptional regulator [Kiritimatiellaeota bacterium]|nr:GntR family transcriptional regulator [Kiritimatiellota bacterium]
MTGIVQKFKSRFKADIDAGVFGGAGRLPSIRQLSKRYEVSTASVKRAVDELQNDGVLVAVHGKGIFIGGTPVNIRRVGSKVIGAILLTPREHAIINDIKNRRLEDGWLFAVYAAGTDLQEPEKERLFLEEAERQGFAGIVMVPTPLHPLNTDFYRRLRFLGVKLVMLAPYRRKMGDECYCHFDHAAGVELAVGKAIESGSRNIVYVGSRDKYFSYATITLEAYEREMRRLGRPAELAPFNPTKLREWVLSLPDGTAILARHAGSAAAVAGIASPAGRLDKDDLSVTNLFGDEPPAYGINQVMFDLRGVLERAVDFVMDEKTSSTDTFQRLFPPTFFHHR